MSELVIVAMFGVLLAVIVVLIALLYRVLPLLHESVSTSNLAPLYNSLLPLAKDAGSAAYTQTLDALKRQAERTPNTIDDQLVKQIEAIVAKAMQDYAMRSASNVSATSVMDSPAIHPTAGIGDALAQAMASKPLAEKREGSDKRK